MYTAPSPFVSELLESLNNLQQKQLGYPTPATTNTAIRDTPSPLKSRHQRMEFTLRCNNLKCRVQLNSRAVVTTCSHIFCTACSDSLGLSNPSSGHRICPACDTSLPNPDDAVLADLNPSDDYKTSVLSGLSPQTIMDCVGRGLGFWTYQATQEMHYTLGRFDMIQESQGKTFVDKYGTLSNQVDRIINNANTQIESLQNKLDSMTLEANTLQRKNHELMQTINEKVRKQQETQHLYDKLKQRAMLSHVQTAANESVPHILNSAAANRYADQFPGVHQAHLGGMGSSSARDSRPTSRSFPVDHNGVEQLHRHQKSGSAGNGDAHGTMGPPPTGIRQRTRLPIATQRVGAFTPQHQQPRNMYASRQPLGSIDNNPGGQSFGVGRF
ncbi:MAG: hypothetical protein M1834_004192 [Cirrosporium novae-zelandiae]|nr:MAG: hypothetical protein M1834_004192 [Cirrosporium novae-zelandiae]